MKKATLLANIILALPLFCFGQYPILRSTTTNTSPTGTSVTNLYMNPNTNKIGLGHNAPISLFEMLGEAKINTSERLFRMRVTDAPNDVFEITNATNYENQFVPHIWAHRQSDNRYVVNFHASTNSGNDAGNIPMIIFRVDIRDNVNFNQPEGSAFPWGTLTNTVQTRPLFDWVNGASDPYMRMLANGHVGIGTSNPGVYRLAVNGSIKARELVIEQTGWPDFVFANDYNLPLLADVEDHIIKYKHLPEIPSAKEVEENGVSVGDLTSKLLQKIEELTLYLIEQEKVIQQQNIRISDLELLFNEKDIK